MKLRGKIKKGYVFVLAAIMLLPCISLLQAQAAGGINTDAECSLTVSVDASAIDFKEKISVSVYQVATVDTTGQIFTPTEGFEDLDFGEVSKKPSDVIAKFWEDLAKDAAEILEENSAIRPAGITEVKRQSEGDVTAIGEITGLKTGMYLVVPEACYNPDYTVQYVFAPSLTALPSSEYALTGMGSDVWEYETTISLKPDSQTQYGKLRIIKNLKNYNATLGQATFVFHIAGVDTAGVTKYDEVVSLDFTAAGTNTITVEKIPAGLDITVTEIYSGASYKIEGSGSQTTIICSDAAVAAGAKEAFVSFTNDYDGGNRSGYGVTNHFESDGKGGWTWENPTTPAGK